MSSIYHTRGFLRAMFRQPAWHVREWIRSPAYRALHRFNRRLGRLPRRTRASVEFQGRKIQLCDNASFLSAWDEIFVNRIYEVAVPAGEKPVLVDAGANIGLAALFWKWRFDRFTYLGFEPDATVAACCRENLQAWGVDGELQECALGAGDGIASFAADGADAGRIVTAGGAANVQVRRLAPLLPERVDLLKIDVEGAESEVLEDIASHLGRVRNLFVEWHSRCGEAGLGEAIARLESAGFDCYVQVAIGPHQPFLHEPDCGFSQNLNLYCVRQ